MTNTIKITQRKPQTTENMVPVELYVSRTEFGPDNTATRMMTATRMIHLPVPPTKGLGIMLRKGTEEHNHFDEYVFYVAAVSYSIETGEWQAASTSCDRVLEGTTLEREAALHRELGFIVEIEDIKEREPRPPQDQ